VKTRAADFGILWRLTIPFGLASSVCLALGFICPAGGLFINLAVTLFGIVVTVNYVNGILARRDRLAWSGALKLVAHRLVVVSSSGITGIREALSISLSHFQPSSPLDEKAVMQGYLEFCELWVEPAIPIQMRGLDQKGWAKLARALSELQGNLDHVLVIFGSRIRPTEYQSILEIEELLRGVLGQYATIPEMLGVPDEDLPQLLRVSAPEYKRAVTARAADSVGEIVMKLRTLGSASLDFEAEAQQPRSLSLRSFFVRS